MIINIFLIPGFNFCLKKMLKRLSYHFKKHRGELNFFELSFFQNPKNGRRILII